MPASYSEVDGKINTRFSELVHVISRGKENARYKDKWLKEKLGLNSRESNIYTSFGEARHEVLAHYCQNNRTLPPHFGVFSMVNLIESEMNIEYNGVILHFTPDVVSTVGRVVYDLKTTYKNIDEFDFDTKQLSFYAWCLKKMGHKIKHGMFLVEQWDKTREELLDYYTVDTDLEDMTSWVDERILILKEWYKDIV